jgi:hypothetical protein
MHINLKSASPLAAMFLLFAGLSGPALAQALNGSNLTLSGSITQNGTGNNFFNANNNTFNGRACIGTSCDGTEPFEQGPLRLKWSEPDILFEDSSTLDGISSNDWRLVINDVTVTKFAVQDIDGGTIPFTIEGGVPTDTLVLESSGEVGIGTSNPETRLHIVDGDSPTLRLQQDGSGGMAPQVWDIGGNETNFFVRDGNNGNQLPFKILAGADTDALVIASTNNIGLGTTAPAVPLHIRRSDGTAQLLIEDTGVANGNLSMMQLTNNSGRARMQFTSVGNPSQTGDWSISSGLTFVLQERLEGKNVFVMSNNGDLAITGQLTTAGSCAAGCDRVFDADYDLPSIADHQAMMWENGYLPNVGPTAEDAPFNVSNKMGRMLNELEHAHIYIGQLHDRLALQEQQNAALQDRLAALEALAQR